MFPREAMARIGNASWDVFYAPPGVSVANDWKTWVKPPGAQFVYIWVLGPGGGGGKGAGGAATTAASGGGSGGITALLIPAFLLPDVLYIRPGNGGAGATTNVAGSTGTTSFVCTKPITSSGYRISYAFGGAGGSVDNVTPGAGAAVAGGANHTFGGTGVFLTLAGKAGTAGASAANGAGSAATWAGSAIPISGGAGGGNGTGAGGSQTLTNTDITVPVSGGAGTAGGVGADGYGRNMQIIINPNGKGILPLLSFTGGAGGGGSDVGTAGAGGNGGYGCGGGGGGNTSTAGGIAGNGGNGGDGLVIIGSF